MIRRLHNGGCAKLICGYGYKSTTRIVHTTPCMSVIWWQAPAGLAPLFRWFRLLSLRFVATPPRLTPRRFGFFQDAVSGTQKVPRGSCLPRDEETAVHSLKTQCWVDACLSSVVVRQLILVNGDSLSSLFKGSKVQAERQWSCHWRRARS